MDWSTLDRPEPERLTGEAPLHVDVIIEHMRFVPKDVVVRVGGTVTWHNLDNVPHSASSGTPEAPDHRFNSPLLDAGETFTVSFDDPGDYLYFCSPHANIMRDASLVVLEPPDES